MILLKYYSSGESKVYRVSKNRCYEGLGLYNKIPLTIPFVKRILLLGKDSLFVSTKKFPLLSESELRKAIGYQISELVPFEEPDFGFKILRRGENFLEAKIWAWDKRLTEELAKDFPFSYVLPEEELFRAEEPTLFVVKKEKGYLFVFSEKKESLNSLFLKPPITESELKLFLKSVRRELTEIKKVFLYGTTREESEAILPSVLRSLATYRESLLEDLPGLISLINLKNYRLKRASKAISLEELLRFAVRYGIIITLAVEANLLFSLFEYERTIKVLREKLSELERVRVDKGGNLSHEERRLMELAEEVHAHIKYSYFPFMPLLNRLAELLPEGTRLINFQIVEGVANFNIECPEPEEIIKRLRGDDLLRDFKLKEPPILDRGSNLQRLEFEVDLRGTGSEV